MSCNRRRWTRWTARLAAAAIGSALVGGRLPASPKAGPGRLDPSFGNRGRVLTDFGARDQANAIGRQANGKFLAVGSSNAGGTFDFAVARYRSDGTLDRTFGA